MKKNFKRTLAKVMAVALTVSLMGTAADADAAKKIKLSKKSITVTKGKSKKVTIKNVKTKKVKKLTVKTTKKKVATVKKAGKTAFKVTGKKVGSAKIKVTVKVKGKKKATKLTLKVTVAKKGAVTPAASTAATAAPTAAASAPAASAPATPGETPANPAETPANPDETPVVDAVPPSQPPKPTTDAPVFPQMNLREEMVPAWVTGGEYGTAIFNTDDTVKFSSQNWAVQDGAIKPVSVYNNGIAWYIAADKSKVDLSSYATVEITLATDAEVKLMTWGGATDPENFWDKKDTWGGVKETIENADGSKTLVYNVADIFGNPKKATVIGFTLKSAKSADDDSDPGVAKEALVYSIKFVAGAAAPEESATPEESAAPAPTQAPTTESTTTESGSTESGSTESGSTETNPTPAPTGDPAENVVALDLVASTYAGYSEVTPVESGDATVIPFTKNNQRAWFSLPEDLDLSKVTAIKVTADVPEQLSASIWGSDFSMEAENWWNNALVNGYPFYGGSGDRKEDGGINSRGVETYEVAVSGLTGVGGYFSLGSNLVPADVQNEVCGWDGVVYKIYSVELVLAE